VASSNLAAPIKGRVYRITKLDVCGNPVTGATGMQVVSAAFTKIGQDPQYEEGTEFFERTASGGICVNQKDDPILKRINLAIDFCAVNVSAAAYMASARELTVGAPTTGYGFAVSEGASSNRFSLEVWQEVAGSGACSASGLQQYIYNAWPNVGAAKVGNYDIELARSTLQITAETRAISTSSTVGWLAKNGSATWLPAGFAVVGLEHWLWNITTTAPPTAATDPTANL
jgi:hypothetical protein